MKLNATSMLVCAMLAAAPCSGVRGGETLVSTQEQLAAAIASARPGGALVVADGTYENWRIRFKASGADGQPVVLRAQTPGKVKLTGRVRLEIEGDSLKVSGFAFERAQNSAPIVEFRRAKNCRLTDCAFLHCGDPKSTFTRTIELAYGSRRCRVDHCFMTGTLSMGMGVKVGDNEAGRGNTQNKFDHNYFKDIKRLASNGQEPIQLGQVQTLFGGTSTRAIVEYNLFDNASGDSEIISNKSADNTIRRNTLRNSRAGICLRGGSNALVEANYCYRTRGLQIFGNHHTIVNNYLEETDGGVSLDAGQYRAGAFVDREKSGSYEAASDVVVAHNTIVNPRRCGICLGRNKGEKHEGVAKNAVPERITIVNNLLVGAEGVLVSDDGSRQVRWRSNIASPGERAVVGLSDAGLLQAAVKLVRVGGLWRLPESGSPARDAGAVLKNVSFDFDGQPRDDRPDIGADEVSGAPISYRPLTPQDVGPSWMR